MANPNGQTLYTPIGNTVTFGGQTYVVTQDTIGDVYVKRKAFLEQEMGRPLSFSERVAVDQALRAIMDNTSSVLTDNGEKYDPKTGVDLSSTWSAIKSSVAVTVGEVVGPSKKIDPLLIVVLVVAGAYVYKRYL